METVGDLDIAAVCRCGRPSFVLAEPPQPLVCTLRVQLPRRGRARIPYSTMRVLFAFCGVLLVVSLLAETYVLLIVSTTGLFLLALVALERRARHSTTSRERWSDDELDELDHDGRRRRDRQLWLLTCIKEQDWSCARCKKPLPAKLSAVHLDHKIPLVLGGSSAPENLQALCARCNLSKGTRAL